MSFISKAGRSAHKNMLPISELDRQMETGYGRPTLAGVPVSEQSALSLIEVQKCVRVRAETHGCLETKVYRWADTARRRKEEARDHPLYELLNVAPNDETDIQSYMERQEAFLCLWGNDASVITRNTSRNKNVTEIYQLEWWKLRPKRNPDTRELYYEYWDRGKAEIFPKDKIFHINTMSLDGIIGLSVIGTARESVGQGLAMQAFSNRFFGRGMHMGGIIEYPGSLGEKERENIKKAALELAGGLENSWEPYVLEEGVKWQSIPMTFVDAQFVDMMKLNKIDIDGLFRVPPPLVGSSYEGLTYSNVEQLSLTYVLYTLLTSVTRFERMANWKLLTPQEREAGYFVKTNINTLLRADAKTRGEYFKNKIQNGGCSPNDWREADDENPINDPSGDEYYANGNFRTLKQIVNKDIGDKASNNRNGGDEGNAE